jgi:hypothetical protein
MCKFFLDPEGAFELDCGENVPKVEEGTQG